MKIEIMSGQSNVKLNDYFTELLDKNGIYVGDIKQDGFIIYPEYKIANQNVILKEIREKVAKYIAENKDLYVLTYSDHVFNAIRLEIKKNKLKGCVLHNVLDDGSDVLSYIDEDGHLSYWQDGVFDTWDNALTELLT